MPSVRPADRQERRHEAPPARGVLEFARSDDRTVATRVYASSPLKLLTPQNAGHAAWVYASTYGGGMVDGDDVSISIEVGEGAAAFVSTQASTKVYRSPRGSRSALSARVGEGGLLALVPDPVVCFAGSSYRQQIEIELSAGANLVLVDWVTSGRRAFGERWKFDNYDGHIFVRCNARPIVYDALSLRSADGDLAARLGRFNVLAVAIVVGPSVAADAERARDRVAGLPVETRSGLLQTASRLEQGGIFRFAGISVEDVGRALRESLEFLPHALGDDPWSRKW